MKTLKPILAALVLLCLLGQAGWAQDDEDVNPLDGVLADMQQATARLGRLLTDKPTQIKQKDAVDKLDVLIKLLEERRRQGGGGAGAMPETPAPDSIIKSGPGGSGPLHAAQQRGNAWGQLPAHKREQILQSMTEGFPPHYRTILESYYRHLADENPAGEALPEGARAAGPDLDPGAATTMPSTPPAKKDKP